MYTVLNKQIIAEKIKRMEIQAPRVASKAQAGQFVMLTPDEHSERIPLSLVEWDARKGAITVVFEEVNASTERLGALKIGEKIYSLLGPLGSPSEIKNVGVAVCIGYGIYIAQLLSVCRALRQVGNKVVGIIGVRTKRALFLESQMRLACNKLFVTTDDGSYERRGSVIGVFDKVLVDEKPQFVYMAAPVEITEMVAQMTRAKKIRTRVRLNPVIIDGTGLCGTSGVRVGSREVSACLEGPDFDGQLVDFHNFSLQLKSRRTHAVKAQKDYIKPKGLFAGLVEEKT